jgi:hypothetical protein
MPPQSDPKVPARYEFEWAVERAMLPTICKDVLYALARRMQQGSTLIYQGHSPLSLTYLAKVSGWSRRHVERALNYLELVDVVIRTRPSIHDARTKHAVTRYAVNYHQLVELGPQDLQRARDAVAHGLGPRRRKPKDGGTSALGTAGPEAGDTAAHSSQIPQSAEGAEREIALIIRVLQDRTGKTVSRDWAATTRDLILARPANSHLPPMARIRRVLLMEKHPERWLPTSQPPNYKKEESQ